MVSNSINDFLGFLSDKSPKVQYECLTSLNTICEEAGLAILKHQNFVDILKLLVEKLSVS